MFKGIITAIIYFTVGVNFLMAQKIEKESRIREDDFPMDALQYLNTNYPDRKKVKYYQEQTKDNSFYESKFLANGGFYSIKFHRNGALYDIEKIINESDVEHQAWQNIESVFAQDFKRWKIKKIQKRWFEGAIEYEIVLEGKLKNQVKPFEYNFSKEGKLIEKQVVKGRFTDIMFY